MLKEVCRTNIYIILKCSVYLYNLHCLLVPRLLNIETIENCMKLCPMVVQALWEFKSPFLQLPYITEDHLKHFDNKKVSRIM